MLITLFILRLLVRAATLQEVSQLVKDEIKIQRKHDGGDKPKYLYRAQSSYITTCP